MNKTFFTAFALVAAANAFGPTLTKVEDTPTKSHQVATMLTLSAITAMTGVDRFYLGYVIMGALKAITFGGGGIWALIDAIFISHCWLKDNWDRVLDGCPADQAKSLAEAINDTGDAAKANADAADDASMW